MPVDDRRTAEGLFGKKGTVSAVRKGILSFLKLKGKGYLYGGRERSRCIQTGTNLKTFCP